MGPPQRTADAPPTPTSALRETQSKGSGFYDRGFTTGPSTPAERLRWDKRLTRSSEVPLPGRVKGTLKYRRVPSPLSTTLPRHPRVGSRQKLRWMGYGEQGLSHSATGKWERPGVKGKNTLLQTMGTTRGNDKVPGPVLCVRHRVKGVSISLLLQS